jgi:hypothetical protein
MITNTHMFLVAANSVAPTMPRWSEYPVNWSQLDTVVLVERCMR